MTNVCIIYAYVQYLRNCTTTVIPTIDIDIMESRISLCAFMILVVSKQAGLSREECTSIHAQQWPSTRQWHNDDVVHDVAKFLDSLSQVRMTKQRKGLPQAVKVGPLCN